MVSCDQNCDLCILHSRERVPDLELVQRVLDGDTSMFEILLHRYCHRLYRVAMAILLNEAEAEDAVQQACINAYLHLKQFERRSSFATWLTTITVNEARARLRPRRSNFMNQLDDADAAQIRSDAVGPEEECMAAELSALLKKRIEALPSPYRIVFDLRRNEGLSTQEVATRLGVATDVVKTRLYRARQMLRAGISSPN